MAVTLKIEDKSSPAPSKKGPKSGPNATGLDAYALERDNKNGLIALGTWLGILALLCAPWWISEVTRTTFGIGMPLWCLFSILVVMFMAPGMIVKKIRQSGKGAIISSQNQAPVKSLIGKASKILAIAEPDALIESPALPPIPAPKKEKAKRKPKAPPKPEPTEEELGRFKSLIRGAKEVASETLKREEKPQVVIKNLGAPSVRPIPGAVLIHKDAFTSLEPAEISALLMRALVDHRQGHARRLFVLDFIDTVQPRTMLYLVWPVALYAKLLRSIWLPTALQNTDRIAMLLVKNPNLMLSAILKDHAARDYNMQEMNVSTQDVSNWVNQRGHIGGSGEEISTQYKLGRAIHEDQPLEERLHKLQAWAKSAEFTAALEKLRTLTR
jgi:hypothetical protein